MSGTRIAEFMPTFTVALTATTLVIMGISAAIEWWEQR